MPKPEVYLPILHDVRAQLIANCVVVFLVLAVVVLRITGRLLGPGLGWDDGFVMLALPLGIGMLVCQGVFAPLGNGYNMAEHPALIANVPFILQLTFGMQLMYIVQLAAVKASMLCFFLRVFVTDMMWRAVKITLVFLVAWMLAFAAACVFLCHPIEAQWTGKGKCGKYIPLIQSLIATNAVGDLIIMILPMHSIWSLQMRKTDKIGITSCFALGLACIVCAVFRLIYISTVELATNVTGTMPTTVFLFILEPNLAILCVSLPMLRPFYSMYKKRIGGSRLQESSDDGPTISAIRKITGQSSSRGKSATVSPLDTTTTGLGTTWEMDDYYGCEGASHGVMVESNGDDDRSRGSTARLAPTPKAAIGVETKWTVTRT